MIKKTDIEESIDGFVREDKSDGSQDFEEKSDFGSAIVYDDAVKGMKRNRELVRKNLEPVRKASDEFAKECADRKGAGVPKTADLKAMGLSESFVEYVNENFSECHNGMLRCSNIRSAQKLAEAANRNGVRFTARRIGEGYVFHIKGNTHPMHEEAGSGNGLKVTGRPDAIAKAYDYLTKENKAIDIEKVRRDQNGITVTGLGVIPEKALADDLKDRFGVECSGNGLSEMLNLDRYCREDYAKTHFHHYYYLKVTGSPEEVKKVYDYLVTRRGPYGTVVVDKDKVTETYDKGFIFVYDLVPGFASDEKDELEGKFNVEVAVFRSKSGVLSYHEGMKESDNDDDDTSSLDPEYDRRKSFYHKAKVVSFKDGRKVLYSYGTPVCRIGKDGKATLLRKGYYGWGSSATTLRHVKEFLKQNGFRADSSSQIGRDYPTEQAEVDESLGREDGNYQVVMWECDECRRPDYDSETDCGRFDTLSEAIDSASSYGRHSLNEEYAVLDKSGNVLKEYFVPAGKDAD